MDNYIGVGFVILCFAVLVFVIAIAGYAIRITKKELDVHPAKEASSPNPKED